MGLMSILFGNKDRKTDKKFRVQVGEDAATGGQWNRVFGWNSTHENRDASHVLDLQNAAHGFFGAVEVLEEIGEAFGVGGVSVGRRMLLEKEFHGGIAGVHFHYLVDERRSRSDKCNGVSGHRDKLGIGERIDGLKWNRYEAA